MYFILYELISYIKYFITCLLYTYGSWKNDFIFWFRYPHQYQKQKRKMILMDLVLSGEEQDASIML